MTVLTTPNERTITTLCYLCERIGGKDEADQILTDRQPNESEAQVIASLVDLLHELSYPEEYWSANCT